MYSLNIISCSHNSLFCSHKKYILFPQHTILFPQNIILFPQYIISFAQHIILFPLYCYDLRVKDRLIDCLYVYLLDILCATHDLLVLVQLVFHCDACTSVWVAQRVFVYEWTFIYISGIVIANIYCMYIIILYAKVCMVRIKFILIAWPKKKGGGLRQFPALFLLINLVSHFLAYFIHSR